MPTPLTQCPPHCKGQQSYRSRTDILISVFTTSRRHLLSKTSGASVFLRCFFTHTHLMRCLSWMVNLIAVMTLLLMSRFISYFVWNLPLRNYTLTLKFSFKLVTSSESYARKQQLIFFMNTVYLMSCYIVVPWLTTYHYTDTTYDTHLTDRLLPLMLHYVQSGIWQLRSKQRI